MSLAAATNDHRRLSDSLSTEQSRDDTAHYLYALISSLQKVAASQRMPLLVHLLDLARLEAKRNCEDKGNRDDKKRL